jgi:Cu2+-exporting ATPase
MGMENFYRERNGYSAKAPEAPGVTEELRLFDTRADLGTKSSYAIEGIRCAACIWLIERSIRGLQGVDSADLNIGNGILNVECDASRCKPSDILAALQSIGYRACPADATPYSERLQSEKRGLSRRLFIAGLSMMQVMMYAVPAYLASDGTMDRDTADLMRWAGFILTLPAVFYSAQPFFSGAWGNLKNRVLGMDVPVALGIAAAFAASVAATLAHRDPVYFDSITMFIFLLLASRTLELHARLRAATALDAMLRTAPSSARRMPHWPQDRTCELVATDVLQPGDAVLLRAGDVLAADAVILEGETRIDLSVLTGESRAQRRVTGDALPAGASNLANPVTVRISRAANASTLALILDAARRARLQKPSLASWADTVAARFVGMLLLLALGSFLYWLHADASKAWPVLISVLVVSCPCALSLAAPTVLAAANARLLGEGILAVRPHVLETLHRATHIVFDKTGTLTSGKPMLHSIETTPACTQDSALAIAASIAVASSHPLSVALCEAACDMDKPAIGASPQGFAGQGMEAEIGGHRYRLGRAEFVAQLCESPAPFASNASGSEVCLGCSAGWLARFVLQDAPRRDAAAVIAYFKAAGKCVILLSGDRQGFVEEVARRLTIDEAVGDCLPEQKFERVRALQHSGAIVAMVGDGINDAAVLGAADVSFAMGEGSSLAQASADCILLSGRLESLCEVDRIASKSARLMKQNLAWAACYNLAAIPGAALAMVNPWMSAIGMSVSSMLVVLNALRIYRKSRARSERLEMPAIQPAVT